MNIKDKQLYNTILKNQSVHAAWLQPNGRLNELVLCVNEIQLISTLKIPDEFSELRVVLRHTKPLTTLLAPLQSTDPQNEHQECQDEPILLGTQIQPHGATWVGTAGAPMRWTSPDGEMHWGILSNWHVMADGHEQQQYPQHQPDDSRPTTALLKSWSSVDPNGPNEIDAALADASVDGFHTISDRILGIGPIGPKSIRAEIGMAAIKSGRTTGVTTATCIAVGAAMTVGYGSFEATFVDQDVYSNPSDPFSGPGDSGSMILGANCKCPASLLFAGNDLLTIGNPMRHVDAQMKLVYPFT